MQAGDLPEIPILDRRVKAMATFYALATVALFGRFYWVVPISAVGLVALALTVAAFLAAWNNPARGLLALTFAVPLVGSLHHMAPVHCPPPLLLIAAGFVMGWWFHYRKTRVPILPAGTPGTTTASLLYVMIAVTGILTAWRYLEFVPFGAWPGLDAPINVKQETVATAIADIWQVTVVGLSGPMLFIVATRIEYGKGWLGRWARLLLAGTVLAYLMGVAQLVFAPSFGIDPHWVERGRISGTFTDPNAMGIFAALVFPLAAALAFTARDVAGRLLGVAVVLLTFVMLAGSGSRTGAAGILLAVILYPVVLAFRLHAEDEAFKSRVLFSAMAVLILLLAFAPGRGLSRSGNWPLLERLSKTREMIAREGLLAPLIRDRWPLWEPAAYVAGHYPEGGIGLGAFRYEVDNVAKLDARDWKWIDNANNFYIHTVTETGLPGLAIYLAAFSALAVAMIRVLRSGGPEGEDLVVYSALAVGWFGFLVLLTTALWLAFEQIQLVFWMFAALFASRPEGRRDSTGIPVIAVGLALIGVMAAYQVGYGLGDLSPEQRRARLNLHVGRGFHAWETDSETGRRFRWTEGQATMSVPISGRELRVEVRALNPDLATQPLPVWFTLDGKLAGRREIRTTDWQWIEFPVPAGVSGHAELTIHVDRTWQPPGDDRQLGIAVGRIASGGE